MYANLLIEKIGGILFRTTPIYIAKFKAICAGNFLLFKDEEYIPQGNKNTLLGMRS